MASRVERFLFFLRLRRLFLNYFGASNASAMVDFSDEWIKVSGNSYAFLLIAISIPACRLYFKSNATRLDRFQLPGL